MVKRPHRFAAATTAAIITTDRAEAERLSAENAYGRAHCAWQK